MARKRNTKEANPTAEQGATPAQATELPVMERLVPEPHVTPLPASAGF